jgi:hypothetical protein
VSERIDFEFVGTTSASLSLDPTEFVGSAKTITAEIKRLLSEIKPDVSFFEDDVELAAEQLQIANGKSPGA